MDKASKIFLISNRNIGQKYQKWGAPTWSTCRRTWAPQARTIVEIIYLNYSQNKKINLNLCP